MNRKIFTLLVGAIMLVSSMFTVNAQRTLPYTSKISYGDVNFSDLLTVDTVRRLPANPTTYYYLLSVTGIENATPTTANFGLSAMPNATSSLVLSIHGTGATRDLRLEYLPTLDTAYVYAAGNGFGSTKFGALRRAMWCLDYYRLGVSGSNIVYDFKQIETGVPLMAPAYYDHDNLSHAWHTNASDQNLIFTNDINTLDPRLIVNGWHFSQTYTPGAQDLQVSMPLYSYVSVDSVAVLCLDDNSTYTVPPAGSALNTGGLKVSVKHVAVSELIADAFGHVNGSTWSNGLNTVSNVLLFTLKKVNPFVMNADDWNAFNDKISFGPDANIQVTNREKDNSYINPYTMTFAPLQAYEVHDSLYHYGYMQFERTDGFVQGEGDFLYVDTAYVNEGNNPYLAFAWSDRRDSTSLANASAFKWGQSFTPSIACATHTNAVLDRVPYQVACNPATDIYWRLDSLFWAIFEMAIDQNLSSGVEPWHFMTPLGQVMQPIAPYTNALIYTPDQNLVNRATEIIQEAIDLYALGVIPDPIFSTVAGLPLVAGTPTPFFPSAMTPGDFPQFDSWGPYWTVGDNYIASPLGAAPAYVYTPKNYTDEWAIYSSYTAEAENFLWAYMKDSIMENQSKFRVVYNPWCDSTYINVYQSRMRYEDYALGSHNATLPPWWTNSFGMVTWTSTAIIGQRVFTRPQDLLVGQLYDGTLVGSALRTITEAADEYFSVLMAAPGGLNRRSDVSVTSTGAWTDWVFEGHGDGFLDGSRSTLLTAGGGGDPSIFNLHSFMEFYPQSSIPGIDRVLISTADTCRIWNEFGSGLTAGDFGALGHIYGWSLTSNNLLKFRDSLLYVDIQSLENDNRRILTLDQSYKNGNKLLDTKISINYGDRCEPSDVDHPATIENDLYLIRSTSGRYLSVALWSISDSIYWFMPEAWEDPTKIPAYQWVVKNIRNSAGSPFVLQNREFENVTIPFMYAFTEPRPFEIAGDYRNATFNRRGEPVIGYSTPTFAAGNATTRPLEINDTRFEPVTFAPDVEKLFPRDKYSFIRLGQTVKEDQLLGYTYIDRDATYIDVYAFKFLHFLTGDVSPRYISWKGYDDETDPVVYVQGQDYYDKLYFMLQEMGPENIFPAQASKDNDYNGRITLTDENTKDPKHDNYEFRDLYLQLASKDRNYTNADSIVMERFGYWEPYSITGVQYLKPMARQAYRLFLQDYYRWHPTLKGDYVTVGEQDRYIMLDKAEAGKPYVQGSGSVIGIFGIPHFYFRNTFFDVHKKGDDYFAIVQRIDTARNDIANLHPNYFEWGTPTFADIEEYLRLVLSNNRLLADKVKDLIMKNHEFALALLDVDSWGRAKFVLRAEANVGSNISAFQLERDEDPIYRRFHKNEPFEIFGGDKYDTDLPDTLEFHLLNQGEVGLKLFENSGNYLDNPIDMSDLYGRDGGRIYNRYDDGRGDFITDSLGNVISFLGQNNSAQFGYPNKNPGTNYAFFLDTAYINRGTGWIKPQYLLAVDPYNPIEAGDCDVDLGGWFDVPNKPYVLARYLYNASQYAKVVKDSVLSPNYEWEEADVLYTVNKVNNVYKINSNNFNKVEPIMEAVLKKPLGKAFTYNDKWERIPFAWAIHIGDSLIVLKGIEPGYDHKYIDDPQALYNQLVKEYGFNNGKIKYLDFPKLVGDNQTGVSYQEVYYPLGDRSASTPTIRTYHEFKSMDAVKAAGNTIGIHAIINLADNTHKDWVWSFRYVERGSSDFVIESETSQRDVRNGAIIRPGAGAWIKVQNGVPAITRSDEKDNMGQAGGSVMNVKQLVNPVGNESIGAAASSIQVIGGTGAVTILNAEGKKLVISNMLGQTIANVTLTSDNASIAAPAGVVVVAVEGETAAKVIVK